MAEILGAGVTHYPPMLVSDEEKAFPINITLARDERVPEHMKNPANWPEAMRVEYGEDEGVASAATHRERLVKSFRVVNDEIKAFNPDFVLIFGDDQYENFREDIIPPFCILAYEGFQCTPFMRHGNPRRNVWEEAADKVFSYRGHPVAARFLTGGLLDSGVDMAYSYKPLHRGLGHAFVNSILYLDWDRRGFPYPVVPFTVNSYGRKLVGSQGVPLTPSAARDIEDQFDPPGPQPWRCFDIGAATARAFAESPWRVALIASSSWSHSFLTAKHSFMYPDVESDKRYFKALRDGDWETWRKTSLPEAEDRGHHELLNWFALAGAMSEIGRKPDDIVFLESWISNSDKVFALFRPPEHAG